MRFHSNYVYLCAALATGLVVLAACGSDDSDTSNVVPSTHADSGSDAAAADAKADTTVSTDAATDSSSADSAPEASSDAGSDVATDAAADANSDVAVDSAVDAGADSSADAKADSAVDSSVDAKADSPVDSAIDAKTDSAVDSSVDAKADSPVDSAVDAKTDSAADSSADAKVDSAADSAVDAKVDAVNDAKVDSASDAAADVVPASCMDGMKNGTETAPDCGGGTCPKCENSLSCVTNADCKNDNCFKGTCSPPYRHSVTFTGTLADDFYAYERMETTSFQAGYYTYVTWDASKLYFGFEGADVAAGTDANKWVFVYLDVDGDVGGSSVGQKYNSQTPYFPAGMKPDYYLRWRGGSGSYANVMKYDGSNWTEVATAPASLKINKSSSSLEMSIDLADLGLSKPAFVGLVSLMMNETPMAEACYAGLVPSNFKDGYPTDGKLMLSKYMYVNWASPWAPIDNSYVK